MAVFEGSPERGRALLVPLLSSGWLGRDPRSAAPAGEFRCEGADVARPTSRPLAPLAASRADGLGEFRRLRKGLA